MPLLKRLMRMDAGEVACRIRARVRQTCDGAAWRLGWREWSREELSQVLSHDCAPQEALLAAAHRDWPRAHEALVRHFATRAPRFVINPGARQETRQRIINAFPASVDDAQRRADRILAGTYDLLGYRALRFETDGQMDWHLDPVHNRRPPVCFWTDVDYLDPGSGDHKIIWELNRHQHWLELGRAYWLTGDARYRDRFLSELASWLEMNPPLTGINWTSMLELAFRSISWTWALEFFADASIQDQSPWLVDLLLGLDRQLTQVERNLSHYFSPNTHLLGEGLALYVVGRTLPELQAAERRAAIGRTVLLREIDRQIGADGGHCERSAHYHKYTLDFYLFALAIARVTGDPCAAEFERVAGRLAFAARVLASDRGQLPHLGDDDGGALTPLTGRSRDDVRDSLAVAGALLNRPDLLVGSTPEEAFWLLAHPALAAGVDALDAAPPANTLASTALRDTGYYVSRSAAGDHLVIDGGPHGYLNGGHSHADALSLTFARHGSPLLIDSGTGCYTIDVSQRDRFRSTALHNTVVVGDRSQSIPSGPFHWAHTACSSVHRWRTNREFDYFDGSHDGYDPVRHRRHVLALHDDLLVVADLIAGPGTLRATAYWHIDPQWHVQIQAGRALCHAGADRAELFTPGSVMEAVSGDSETGLGWHSPVYGRVEPATTIRMTHTGAAPLWIISVFGWDPDNAIVAVDTVPVWAAARVLDHATALRITRTTSIDYCVIAEPAGVTSASWRVGEVETDARMLFYRMRGEGQMARLALVDGSIVRAGRRGLHLQLPQAAPDLHLDVSELRTHGDAATLQARLSGTASGARLIMDGEERPIAAERCHAAAPFSG
jgi:hypothetical protein